MIKIQIDCPSDRNLSGDYWVPAIPREGESAQIGSSAFRVRTVVWFWEDEEGPPIVRVVLR